MRRQSTAAERPSVEHGAVDASVTVHSVTATPVVVPVLPPVETSATVVRKAPLVLIELDTSHARGTAYVFCYTESLLSATAGVVTSLGDLIRGRQLTPVALARQLRDHLRLAGATGVAGMALGGIDMAAWDAMARSVDAPLYRLLGAPRRPMPAYCSLRAGSPSHIADEAVMAVRNGFRALKIRLGHPDEGRDSAAVDAALSAFAVLNPATGSVSKRPSSPAHASETAAAATNVAAQTLVTLETSVRVPRLMVDYNQALAPLGVHGAARRLERIAQRAGDALEWIEEPLEASDNAGHASLQRLLAVPIQLGENWWGPSDAAAAITGGSADLMMVDAMKIGGVTGWQQTAALAAVHTRPLSSHLFPEVSSHLLAASPTAHWLEVLDLLHPLTDATIEVHDGAVLPSNTPGIGVQWSPKRVTGFTV